MPIETLTETMEKRPTPGKLEIVPGHPSGFEDIIREISPKSVCIGFSICRQFDSGCSV
jgi:hypothetical protein